MFRNKKRQYKGSGKWIIDNNLKIWAAVEDGEDTKDIKMKSVGSKANNNSKGAGFKIYW